MTNCVHEGGGGDLVSLASLAGGRITYKPRLSSTINLGLILLHEMMVKV
jgi:hypothetical protein